MWDSQVHGKEARTGPGQSHLERQPAAIEAGPQPGSSIPRCPAAEGGTQPGRHQKSWYLLKTCLSLTEISCVGGGYVRPDYLWTVTPRRPTAKLWTPQVRRSVSREKNSWLGTGSNTQRRWTC